MAGRTCQARVEGARAFDYVVSSLVYVDIIGSEVGSAVGVVAGLLKSQIDRTSADHDAIDSGLVAGILGAQSGALVAYINSRSRGIYEDVGLGNLAPGLVMRPSGRVGLSLTIGGR